MAEEEKEVSDFRRWLVGKVAMSRWHVKRSETDEAMGRRLGVQPDVLAEAREVLSKLTLKKSDGRTSRLGMPRAGDGKHARYQIFLEPPEAVARDWRAYCERRKLTAAVVLRSAIYHALTLPTQPASFHSGRAAWRYRGQALAQVGIREHRFRLKTYVSEAAYRALTVRAATTGVSASAIARWAVTSLLEGKLVRAPETLWIVSGLEPLYTQNFITRPTLVKE